MNALPALALLLLSALSGLAGAAPVLPDRSPHQSVGVVNCASSMCHGAVAPWQGGTIAHNEYTIWSRLDRHANAFNVLLSKDSQRIARNLGLKKPAHEEKVCLDCHAHNPPPAQRGARFTLSDGVSCEGCHGPAQRWLQSHTAPDASHADNVANGLYPTAQPEAMARLCLSCHAGNDKKLVTHRIMGAGHPRLSFDLDTFANFLPPHWQVDADWKARKGRYDGVQLWAIGQGVAVEALLNTFNDPVQGRDGLFPELVLFDCHACHHPMSNKRWQPRQGIGNGPGRIRLNDANLLMLHNIVKAVSPADAPGFGAQIQRLHRAIAGEGERADPHAEANALLQLVAQQLERFGQRDFRQDDLAAILRALVDEGAADSYADYAGAEQVYMAIAGVASHLQARGAWAPATARALNARLRALRDLLRNDDAYSPAAFRTELVALRQLLRPAR